MSGGYRAYPPPRGPWVMTQTWEDLVFAHWPVEVTALRRVVPASLPLDTYDGRAWLGVVPFHLRRIAPRGLPWGLGFPELNVRTYVTVGDEPGIYFFSLDAANPLAVVGARLAYHLPYFHARMSIRRDGEWIRYASRRRHGGAPPAALRARYRPTGPAAVPPPGTLEYFLTARYCLYAVDPRGQVYRAEIDHRPWPLHPAEIAIDENTMAAAAGVDLPDLPPLAHYVSRIDMVGWLPERIAP